MVGKACLCARLLIAALMLTPPCPLLQAALAEREQAERATRVTVLAQVDAWVDKAGDTLCVQHVCRWSAVQRSCF